MPIMHTAACLKPGDYVWFVLVTDPPRLSIAELYMEGDTMLALPVDRYQDAFDPNQDNIIWLFHGDKEDFTDELEKQGHSFSATHYERDKNVD